MTEALFSLQQKTAHPLRSMSERARPPFRACAYQTSQRPPADARTRLFPVCFWPPPICPESRGRGKPPAGPSPCFCWPARCRWKPCEEESNTGERTTDKVVAMETRGWVEVSQQGVTLDRSAAHCRVAHTHKHPPAHLKTGSHHTTF